MRGARAALAAILLPTLALAAPPRDPGLLALARKAPVAVVAQVRSVKKEDDRVEAAKLRVREAVKGGAEGTIRVVHRRAFASDPSPFREDAFVAAALAPLPTDSYWRRRFDPGDALHLASPRHLREIPETDAAAWRNALAAQEKAGEKGGAALAPFYLDLAGRAPWPLAGDALQALGGLPDLASSLGEKELALLAARLRDGRIDAAARRDLARGLAERKAVRAADALVALAREDAALRPDALAALAALGRESKEARAAAMAGLDAWAADPDPATRTGAVELLAASLDEESIPRLREIAETDPSDEAAVAAVDGLARLGGDDPRFYEAMGEAALRGRRRPAARAIAKLAEANTAKSVETLSTLFSDERYDVQAAAVIALTNIRQPGADEAIRRAYETAKSPQLRRAIEEILSKSRK